MIHEPSEGQWNYLLKLAADRVLPELGDTGAVRVSNLEALRESHRLSAARASELITRLRDAPFDLESSVIKVGVYRHDGQIYVTNLRRDQTGLYARRLVEIGGTRLNAEGDHVKIDYVYAPGVINELRPEERLSWEEAKPLVIRYGMCLWGHPLRDATSVELGVGPVCRRRFLDLPQPARAEVSEETRTALGDMLTQVRSR